jgi:hypothetical protein
VGSRDEMTRDQTRLALTAKFGGTGIDATGPGTVTDLLGPVGVYGRR